MARGGSIPSNAVEVRTVRRGAHPIAIATAAAVDLNAGRGMTGQTGHVRIGEKSTRKFSGELGPLQNFRGARIVGASLNQRSAMNAQQALPNTHTPVSVPNPVMSLLARTQDLSQ